MYKKCNCEDWPCCGHVYDDDEASIDDEALDYDDEEDDYGGDFILFRDEDGNIRFIDNRESETLAGGATPLLHS